jgi:hypothetical protein
MSLILKELNTHLEIGKSGPQLGRHTEITRETFFQINFSLLQLRAMD